MPACKPLAASADISACRTTKPALPMRCSTRFSRFCVLYTAIGLGAVAWLAATGLPEAAVLMAVYGVACFVVYQCMPRDSAAAHVMLAFLCAAFAASCGRAVFFAWVGFIVSVLHVTQAMLIMELDRLGDCQRCLQEAPLCSCGRDKLPLPAGALHDAAAIIQASWRSHRPATSV